MRRIDLTMVVLPTPGPPVMTSALLVSASLIASRWLSGESQAAALLDPPDGLGRIDRWPGKLAAGDSDQPIGDGLLGAIEAGKNHAVGLTHLVRDHGAFGPLEIEGGA